jgi:3-oxoadipate enol-lactonase
VVLAHELAGDGSDLVLLPGTFSDRRSFARVVGALTSRFRCLLLDPRGTGSSPDPGSPFSPDDLADDVLATMDVAGVDRADILGHSLGAHVALLIAARQPARCRRVVAISPILAVDALVAAILDHWEALLAADVTDHQVHVGLTLPAFGRGAFERLVPAVVEELDRRPIGRETMLRYVACDRRQDARPLVSRVDAPVLVVAGAEDALTGVAGATAVAQALPGARLEVIAGSGHTPQLEAPAETVRTVLGFLVGPGAAGELGFFR